MFENIKYCDSQEQYSLTSDDKSVIHLGNPSLLSHAIYTYVPYVALTYVYESQILEEKTYDIAILPTKKQLTLYKLKYKTWTFANYPILVLCHNLLIRKNSINEMCHILCKINEISYPG